MAIICLSIENFTRQKNNLAYTFLCLSCVDPDQLASKEASWSGSTLFSMQDVSS